MQNFNKWLNALDISRFNLQTKIQACDANSILIFNRPRSNQEHIYQLLSNAKYSFILTNDEELTNVQNKILVATNEFQAARAELINKFFFVNKKITYIGITGTNGKTSTTHFLREMLLQLSCKVGSVGTLGYYVGSTLVEENSQTTPDLYDFKKFTYSHQNDIDYFVLEVSSHALDQQRLYGLELECAVWTNFTQDHLDYHRTMDDYFCAKAKILDVLKNTGKLIVLKDHREIWMKINSNKFQIIDTARRNLPIKFDTNFNQENISLALAVVANLGKDTRLIKLDMIPAVPGRFNLEHIDNKIVIIDFAHTPDALENVLKQIREDYVGKKLITVFGCGGDRDRSKRPIMGQIAANFSDEVIVTSDNPRGENPLQIIEDIVSGIKNQKPYYKIENRVEAIKLALSQSINTDIVLIAGKGHETTMNYAGKLIEHNDYDVVKKIREKLI